MTQVKQITRHANTMLDGPRFLHASSMSKLPEITGKKVRGRRDWLFLVLSSCPQSKIWLSMAYCTGLNKLIHFKNQVLPTAGSVTVITKHLDV